MRIPSAHSNRNQSQKHEMVFRDVVSAALRTALTLNTAIIAVSIAAYTGIVAPTMTGKTSMARFHGLIIHP